MPVLVMRENRRELVLPSGPSSFSAMVAPSWARRDTMASKFSELRSMVIWSPSVRLMM